MAEAAVEERPPNPRFFCHKCSVEFEHASPEYTCPHCLGGFIEELEANAEGADDVIDVEDDDDQYNPTWGNEMNAFLAELERQASRPRMSHDLSSRRRRALGTRIPGNFATLQEFFQAVHDTGNGHSSSSVSSGYMGGSDSGSSSSSSSSGGSSGSDRYTTGSSNSNTDLDY